jgi:hypothetical protein
MPEHLPRFADCTQLQPHSRRMPIWSWSMTQQHKRRAQHHIDGPTQRNNTETDPPLKRRGRPPPPVRALKLPRLVGLNPRSEPGATPGLKPTEHQQIPFGALCVHHGNALARPQQQPRMPFFSPFREESRTLVSVRRSILRPLRRAHGEVKGRLKNSRSRQERAASASPCPFHREGEGSQCLASNPAQGSGRWEYPQSLCKGELGSEEGEDRGRGFRGREPRCRRRAARRQRWWRAPRRRP